MRKEVQVKLKQNKNKTKQEISGQDNIVTIVYKARGIHSTLV